MVCGTGRCDPQRSRRRPCSVADAHGYTLLRHTPLFHCVLKGQANKDWHWNAHIFWVAVGWHAQSAAMGVVNRWHNLAKSFAGTGRANFGYGSTTKYTKHDV